MKVHLKKGDILICCPHADYVIDDVHWFRVSINGMAVIDGTSRPIHIKWAFCCDDCFDPALTVAKIPTIFPRIYHVDETETLDPRIKRGRN